MEFSFLSFMKESLLLEAIMLASTIRIIWSQTLAEELSDIRASPLLLFLFRSNRYKKSVILSQIDMIRGSANSDHRSILRERTHARDLILRFNILQSENMWFLWTFVFLLSIAIAYLNPFALVSCIIADLLTARIHYHILSSL
jgi:hypothetical protein